jgi:hypothetical protein
MDAAEGARGAHSHTNLLGVAYTFLHILGQQRVRGLHSPQPLIPDVFTFGNNLLVGAALLGPLLFLVYLVFAIFSFARNRKRPESLAAR